MGIFKVIAILPALLGASQVALAGAANANLSCKGTEEGLAVSLSGSIPGDFAEFELELSSSGKSLIMQSEQDRITVKTAFSRGVFLVKVVLANGSNFQLSALPKTISYKFSHGGQKVDSRFKAILAVAPEPFTSSLSGAVLSCSYAYAI